MNVARELAALRAPDERAAEARAWEIVRNSYRRRPAVTRRRRAWPLALAPALAVGIVGLAMTPAGATVGRLISHGLGLPRAAPALVPLPAPGRLLVSGPGGTWIVSANGSRRHLGPWTEASWSPHGRYIAVVGRGELAAINASGRIQWALARPAVSDPRWYPPSGFRIAYRAGSSLRVVVGDGRGDHLIARGVMRVAPAWRPGHPYQLAYARRNQVIVRDADTGQLIWRRPATATVALQWSADGSRLLVLERGRATVLGPAGDALVTVPIRPAETAPQALLSPNGKLLALVHGGAGAGLFVVGLSSRRPVLRSVLSGPGMRLAAWSPNAHWLLASWPAADQWVFVSATGTPHLAAVSQIRRLFRGRRSGAGFPQVDGWCCTAHGAAG